MTNERMRILRSSSADANLRKILNWGAIVLVCGFALSLCAGESDQPGQVETSTPTPAQEAAPAPQEPAPAQEPVKEIAPKPKPKTGIEGEIDRWVYEPCLLVAQAHAVDSYTDSEIANFSTLTDMIELSKLIDPSINEGVEEGKEAIRPLVRNLDWNGRKHVYKLALQACVVGAFQGGR